MISKTERERLITLCDDFNAGSRLGVCFDCMYCFMQYNRAAESEEYKCVLNPPKRNERSWADYPKVDIHSLNGCSHFKRASWLTRRKRDLAWKKYSESED